MTPEHSSTSPGYWLIAIALAGFAITATQILHSTYISNAGDANAANGAAYILLLTPCSGLFGLVFLSIGLIAFSRARATSHGESLPVPSRRRRIVGLLISILGILLFGIAFLSRKGQSAPAFRHGDEWPKFLLVLYRTGRIETDG